MNFTLSGPLGFWTAISGPCVYIVGYRGRIVPRASTSFHLSSHSELSLGHSEAISHRTVRGTDTPMIVRARLAVNCAMGSPRPLGPYSRWPHTYGWIQNAMQPAEDCDIPATAGRTPEPRVSLHTKPKSGTTEGRP